MNEAMRLSVEHMLRADGKASPHEIAILDQACASARGLLDRFGVEISDPAVAQAIVALTTIAQRTFYEAAGACTCPIHQSRGSDRVNALLVALSHVCAQRLHDIEQGGV